MGYEAYLLDIEGTTTPAGYVYDVLFPYARTHLSDYLDRHTKGASLSAVLAEAFSGLEAEYAADAEKGLEPPFWPSHPDPKGAEQYLLWQMDRDRKSTPLKTIQGQIWELGYRDGRLKGEIYPDVDPAIRRWHAAGAKVCIYSSGSAQSQRLLFAHLTDGDLTMFLSGYFDTSVGPKRDPMSYRAIAANLGIHPKRILFLSDTLREVEAAQQAGLASRQVVREAMQVIEADVITSFNDLE